MKKMYEANKGFIMGIILLVVVLAGVKVVADSLVDSKVQSTFLAGNHNLYQATQQMGFYESDASVSKIQTVTTSVYHTKAWAKWSDRTIATYTPWND